VVEVKDKDFFKKRNAVGNKRNSQKTIRLYKGINVENREISQKAGKIDHQGGITRAGIRNMVLHSAYEERPKSVIYCDLTSVGRADAKLIVGSQKWRFQF